MPHSYFSDIDLVIFGAWSELPLRTIERELLDRNIANPENLKVLDRAAVSTRTNCVVFLHNDSILI